MTNSDCLPEFIENIVEVPLAQRCIYDRNGDVYRLTSGGKKLNQVKQALRDGHHIEHSPLYRFHKPTEIAARDWSNTIAAATPLERRALLKLAGAGQIKVKK